MKQLKITRAIIKLIDDTLTQQQAKIESLILNKIQASRPQQYGLTSNPPEGTIALVAFTADEAIILNESDPETRPKDTPTGQVTLYATAGQKITLTPTGKVIINNATEVIIDADAITQTAENAITTTAESTTETAQKSITKSAKRIQETTTESHTITTPRIQITAPDGEITINGINMTAHTHTTPDGITGPPM